MDSEFREPTWRGVILTLVAIVAVLAILVLLTSYFLQTACPPGTMECVTPSAPPPGG